MIDLHSHTTFSDGEHSPSDLIRLAKQAGIKVLAITDHDTVEGLAEAEIAASEQSITLVGGIELSAELNGREVHILGHFLDYRSEPLQEFTRQQQLQRHYRATEIVDRLRQLDLPCTVEEVLEASNGKNICRPHIARVLLNRGYVRTIAEAFDRFLGIDKPAYVLRNRLPTSRAVKIIRASGGIATLAHPCLNQVTPQEIAQLQKEGIVGVEVGHPTQPAKAQVTLLVVVKNLGLIPTAGTDFHGISVLPDRPFGTISMNKNDWKNYTIAHKQSTLTVLTP